MAESEADKWLEKIQQDKKGKLKIYIGMSAGVGKTFRMLQEAHTLLRNGVNIKVGYVATPFSNAILPQKNWSPSGCNTGHVKNGLPAFRQEAVVPIPP